MKRERRGKEGRRWEEERSTGHYSDSLPSFVSALGTLPFPLQDFVPLFPGSLPLLPGSVPSFPGCSISGIGGRREEKEEPCLWEHRGKGVGGKGTREFCEEG